MVDQPSNRDRDDARSRHQNFSDEPAYKTVERIGTEPTQILDHGFVRLVDLMGNDAAIVEGARVSYGEGTEEVRSHAGLIDYLMEHRHTSPFEMCEIKIHVKMPIFIARQWIRHRTANVNEYSGRYSVMKDERYVPALKDIAGQCMVNKQGRDGTVDDPRLAQDKIKLHGMDAHSVYLDLIDDSGHGMARELARMTLPLNTYTEWYWKIDLHNLFHFLELRMDMHAQKEIRDYANAIFGLCEQWVPGAVVAFREHRLDAAHFSAGQLRAIADTLAGLTHDNASLKDELTAMSGHLKPRQLKHLLDKLVPEEIPFSDEQEPQLPL